MRLAVPIAFAIVVAATAARAQTFQRELGGLVDEIPNCIEHAAAGGYIVAGTERQLPDT